MKKFIVTLANEINKAEITVELRNRPCDVAPYLTVDGEPVGSEYTELSICAVIRRFSEVNGIWFWPEHIGGQCANDIRRLFGSPSESEGYLIKHSERVMLVDELCDLWDRWHLNGMVAGTRAQMEALRSPDFDPKAVYYAGLPDHYASACKYLEVRGLNPDPAVIIGEGTHMKPGLYMYGHAWLVEKLPVEVEKRIKKLCKLLGS